MIENYKIKDNVLYLYLNYDYEFSNELGIINKVNEYIKNMKNIFKGTKVVLVCGGIVLATFFYNPKSEEFKNKYILNSLLPNYSLVEQKNVEEKLEESFNEEILEENVKREKINEIVNEVKNEAPIVENVPIEKNVTIHRKNGSIINLNLNDYLIGVVGAEMPAEFHIEALKALAIAARTYALKTIEDGGTLTDTVSTQVYNDIDELKIKWGSSFDKYYNKIKEAVLSTDNLVITYNNNLISALYFSTSNGYTESAKEVFGYDIPYLQSVESQVDLETTPYLRTIEKSELEILNILGVTNLNIEIISKTESGRIKEIKIDNKVYSGIEIRNLLGLRSTDFDIEVNNDKVEITTRGYGHGVGMSQYGANKLATNGYSYQDIINHYYQGVKIINV